MNVQADLAEKVVAHLLAANSGVPNHPRWPLLVYPGALFPPNKTADLAATFETLFTRNGWPAAWRNGVYPFHHFHCDAHEALGVYSGEVTVQFGGENGPAITARTGDVVVLPAGTGHKKLGSRGTPGIVGAYPAGQHPDMCRPAVTRLAHFAAAVARVALPAGDPVHGAGGPLFAHWK
jgi:uncharacterized protein YjlB